MLYRSFIILCFSLIITGLKAQSEDPILMKIGDSQVSVSEFKYIYEKNNGNGADYSRKSIMEYLDLYTKFKLKVEKARSLQLDTISTLKLELEGYRKQLASTYLIDKEVTEALLKELYNRMDYDVDFSHIFVAVPENATLSQREEAKAKLREIQAKLVSGYEFGAAAAAYSEDKASAHKGGKMGFVTSKLPSGFYELETAIYTTEVGNISDIVESKMGYHIVKVNKIRPARGLIEVAQILVSSDNKALADSISNLAKNGADFAKLSDEFSIDKKTKKNGGKLAPFGINTYSLSFEIGAYTLQNDGDVSNPILTESGWHVIKRIRRVPKDSYDVFVRKMKPQISKDSRFNIAKVKLIDDIKKSAGVNEDINELNKFAASLNEDFYSYKWSPSSMVSTNPIFTIGATRMYSTKDFAEYCKKNTKVRLKYDKNVPIKNTVEELYNNFVDDATLSFEEENLDKKYPDFKSLMREYEEGILLFEVTKMNVWDKANQDSTGLVAFYKTVADKYSTNEEASASQYIIQSSDRKMAEKIYKYAQKNSANDVSKKFNKKEHVVSITEKKIEKGSGEVAKIDWKKNAISALQLSIDGKSYTFTKLNELIPSRKKTLNEARGYVVADYQNYLDKKWLESLEKEFRVVMNNDVLNKLIK